MRFQKVAPALLLLVAPLAWGQSNAICSSTAPAGKDVLTCGAGGAMLPAALTANTIPKATGVNTLGNSTITDNGTTVTINTASTFRNSTTAGGLLNFFSVAGTLPTNPSSSTVNLASFVATAAGTTGVAAQTTIRSTMAGGTNPGAMLGGYFLVTSAGTTTNPFSGSSNSDIIGNAGLFAQAFSSTAGWNHGLYGLSDNGGAGNSSGVFGVSSSGANSIGVAGVSEGGTIRLGGYFSLRTTTPTFISSAVYADNAAVAAPIAVFTDNTAALPTTGATATFAILDGAQPQYGLGVLTNATMTAESQARVSTVTSSYTWSNAQVVALGGTTAGDITVATLPAKTQVLDAMVIITGTAAGVTTLTVSCGDAIAGTPFINYVVASDAKAAANTVYGDAVAERGTSIDTEFWYLPSYTATTLVTCHFISTGANLSAVTGSTGRVILTTRLLP